MIVGQRVVLDWGLMNLKGEEVSLVVTSGEG